MNNITYKILVLFFMLILSASSAEAFAYRDYKAFKDTQKPDDKVFEIAKLPRVLEVSPQLNIRNRGRFGSPRLNYSPLRQRIRQRIDARGNVSLGKVRNRLQQSRNRLRDTIRRGKEGTIFRNNLGRISGFSGKVNIRHGRIGPRRHRVFTPRRRFITRRR